MTLRFLSLPILFGLALFLSACRVPDVVVVDAAGLPIEDAKVVGISLSMYGQFTKTNKNGCASIPSSIQRTVWIVVSKAGYQDSPQIDVSAPKPIKVVLRKL